MQRIRVCLIEEDPWRSRGMGAVISEGGLEVRRHETVERFLLDAEECDVVLVSDAFCRARERETISAIRETVPAARVLILGEFDTTEQAAPLFAAGADGCFSLAVPPERLLDAIRLVVNGKVFGSREALMAAIGWKGPSHERERPRVAHDEVRLLRMLEAGLTNKEIAQRLGFAESTVKARFNRLYRRFGVTSRVQLLTAAMRKGLLPYRPER